MDAVTGRPVDEVSRMPDLRGAANPSSTAGRGSSGASGGF